MSEPHVPHSAATVLDGVPVGIFLTDDNAQCTYVNPAWCDLTGLSPEESLGAGWARAIHPDDRDRVRAEWEASVVDARPFHCEYRFQRPDGSMVFVVGRAQRSHDAEGGEDIYIGSVTDISDRKRAEEVRNDLISVVSHELRGPLAAVHGALGYLQSDTVEGEEARQELLDMAARNSKFLSHLVEDLLVLERLDKEKLKVEVEEVELRELAEEAVAMALQRTQPETRKIDLESDDGVFVADQRRILQVLTNLMGNALKFSQPGTSVGVSAKMVGPETVFTIKDSGRGIPADMIDRVFQPFEQVHADDHNKYGGAGLGLAISRAIVAGHGGKIWVESQVGTGSTFFVSLPTLGPAADA